MIDDVGQRICEHRVAPLQLLAVVVIDFLAESVGLQGVFVVQLTLLAVESEEGDQSFLAATYGLLAVATDERRRQGLLEEADAVEPSREGIVLVAHVVVLSGFVPHHVSEVEVVALHATQGVGGELCLERAVNVDAGDLMCPVDGHGVVMPFVVAEVVAQGIFPSVGPVFQGLTLESDEELVACIRVGGLAGAIADECSAPVLVGLEPEHERVVLFLGAAESLGAHLHSLDFPSCFAAVQTECHSSRQRPRGPVEFEVCSLCEVCGILAGALVHGVVVGESHFVAREQFLGVEGEACGVHGSVPDTSLQHSSFVELPFADVRLVGGAEDDRSVSAVFHAVE